MNDDPISRIKATLDFAGSQGWHPFHCDDICALLAEVDRLRRDAARYRWLRGGPDVPSYSSRWPRWEVRYWDGRYWQTMFAEHLDEVIDAAMKEQEQEQEE